jgi:hypothetical protein
MSNPGPTFYILNKEIETKVCHIAPLEPIREHLLLWLQVALWILGMSCKHVSGNKASGLQVSFGFGTLNSQFSVLVWKRIVFFRAL